MRSFVRPARAVNAHEKREVGVLDDLAIAAYVTDAAGVVRHHNRACVSFAGRVPRVGIDRWCVSWGLYTEDGRRLPHDQCPMAISIGEKRAITGARAIALRPDRTSIRFEPSPIPLFDDNDRLIGAVNLLRAVGDGPKGAALWAEAARCRRLAWCVDDSASYAALQTRALNCEQNAIAFETGARAVPEPIMATPNALLKEMELAAIGEYARVTLEPGTVLLSAGAPINEVYLIEAGMASVVARQGRREVDVAVVGAEGMVGYERLLGAENALQTTVMRFSGSAIRMPANTAIRLNGTEPLFAERHMSFVRGLHKQLAENCAANALLSIESRLARWLLSASERVGPNLMITHEVMASAVGTRRAGVTVGLHVLEGVKAIRSTRARVSVLNRDRLSDWAKSRPA
jgi:CRP-like cAMP-binding protein